MAKALRVIKQGRTRRMPRRGPHRERAGLAQRPDFIPAWLERLTSILLWFPSWWERRNQSIGTKMAWDLPSPSRCGCTFPCDSFTPESVLKIYVSQENKVTGFSLQNFLSVLYWNILVPERNGVIFGKGVYYVTCRCRKDPAKMPLGSSAHTLQKTNKGTTEPLPKHEGGGTGLHHGGKVFCGFCFKKEQA